MRIPRIFLDQELTKNKTYQLDKDSFHHLLVLKKREGDKIEVFNSKGQFLEASISLINKKKCEVFSVGETKVQEKTLPKISLGISTISFVSTSVLVIPDRTSEYREFENANNLRSSWMPGA